MEKVETSRQSFVWFRISIVFLLVISLSAITFDVYLVTRLSKVEGRIDLLESFIRERLDEQLIPTEDAIDQRKRRHVTADDAHLPLNVVESTFTQGGSTYIRWGRTTCGINSRLIHEGFVSSSHYTHEGGATTYQCLPLDPEYNQRTAVATANWMYGAEYESSSFGIFPSSAANQNVPCARCYTPIRSASMMIPGKMTCPTSWIKEYDGYLMSAYYSHKHPSTHECVDSHPEYVVGSSANVNGALFYFNKVSCASTGHCLPYIEAAPLTCVVCTK